MSEQTNGTRTPNQNVERHPGIVDVRRDPAIGRTTHPDLAPKPAKRVPQVMPPAIMGRPVGGRR